jgi:hypothetical protein
MTDESTSMKTSSNEVLEHEVTALAAQIAAATCRFLVLVAELDRRQAWAQCWGCLSMAHWLSWRCSVAPVTAREYVRVARCLEELPVTAAAFAAGELSYSKVRALVRVATPASEAGLVELARTATASMLEQIIRAMLVATSDPSKVEDLRQLTTFDDEAGMGVLRARMRVDELAVVDTALNKALAVDEGDTAVSPIAQRRVSALVRICESYVAHGDSARAPGTRNSAVLHVEVGVDGIETAQTERGTPVPVETARRMLCDASVEGMLGDCGNPIGVGRQTRTINRRMRRALQKRSGGKCEWIGCEQRTFLDGHHIQHWEHGGPTELWNLAHLCWHHHHLVHEGGWRLEHDGRGGIRCYRPDGTELHHAIPALAHGRLTDNVARDALEPLWAGERFDLPACVDAALSMLKPTRGPRINTT